MFGTADFDILTVLAFVSLNLFSFLVIIVCLFFMTGNMSFVFPLDKHLSANLALWMALLSLRVGTFNSFNASWYEWLLFSIRFTSTFCPLSMSFSFFFDMLRPQTTQDCSTLFRMNVFLIFLFVAYDLWTL